MVETQSAPEGFSLSGHKTHKLQESDMTKAPIFEINDSDGKPFKMEDHFPMVLYFGCLIVAVRIYRRFTTTYGS